MDFVAAEFALNPAIAIYSADVANFSSCSIEFHCMMMSLSGFHPPSTGITLGVGSVSNAMPPERIRYFPPNFFMIGST